MPLLEMREARFARAGRVLAPALTLSIDENERAALACGDDIAASSTALMAAGLLKPTGGRVFIAAFDPSIQPVQVKRIVGYVPHEAVPHDFLSFSAYIDFRAALWGLSRAQAAVRSRALLAQLEGVHEAFAHPLAGALLAAPRLLVLDRPQAAYAPQILAAAGACAVFSTHAHARDAERFSAARATV